MSEKDGYFFENFKKAKFFKALRIQQLFMVKNKHTL